jgi:hypothetical protein
VCCELRRTWGTWFRGQEIASVAEVEMLNDDIPWDEFGQARLFAMQHTESREAVAGVRAIKENRDGAANYELWVIGIWRCCEAIVAGRSDMRYVGGVIGEIARHC